MNRTKKRPLPAKLMTIQQAKTLNKMLLASSNALLIASQI